MMLPLGKVTWLQQHFLSHKKSLETSLHQGSVSEVKDWELGIGCFHSYMNKWGFLGYYDMRMRDRRTNRCQHHAIHATYKLGWQWLTRYRSTNWPVNTSNQIFHCTCCITPTRATSLRGSFPIYCAGKTQLLSRKHCRVASRWLHSHCVRFERPKICTY